MLRVTKALSRDKEWNAILFRSTNGLLIIYVSSEMVFPYRIIATTILEMFPIFFTCFWFSGMLFDTLHLVQTLLEAKEHDGHGSKMEYKLLVAG